MVERLQELGLPGVTARTFHAHALSQLRHFWPSRHEGDPMPDGPRLEAPDPRAARPSPARALQVHAREGHRERDRMGQEPPTDAADLREGPDRGARHGPARGPDPGRPLRPDVRGLRARPDAGRPHRLRRPARRDRRPARDGRRGRRDHPRPQALVQRRRVPGHEPAPAAPARAVGRRPAGPVRRRRRGPDDLHVHRRQQPVPDRVRRPASGRPRRDAQRQLPLQPAGPRAREPPARLDRADQAPRDDAPGRPRAGHRPPQHRGRRTRRARRLGARADRGRDRRPPRSRSSCG